MADIARGVFPISYILVVPLLILIVPINPVNATHDFSVYRMNQFDLQGTSYGSIGSIFNLEARTIDANVYTRRCIVAKLSELSIDKIRELAANNAGALLVLLPENISIFGTKEQRETFRFIEIQMSLESVQMPVYFAVENERLLEVYDDVRRAVNVDTASTATQALFSSASANGYQLVVTGAAPKPIDNFKFINVQGRLLGAGTDNRLPTIAIVAHYDAAGLIPMLAKGADSNGSGVVALLSLARLFSRLYSDVKTKANYNLVFLLSSGGKVNFVGSKQWIDENSDNPDSPLLRQLHFAMCLDSLGGGDSLYSHVSKPPKQGSTTHDALRALNASSRFLNSGRSIPMVHKKINLQSKRSWEHELFSISRLPAFTLSHFSKSVEGGRSSILDVSPSLDLKALKRNIKTIAEGLARYIYDIPESDDHPVFSGSLDIEEDMVRSWSEMITSVPRPVQLMTADAKSTQSADSSSQRRSRSLVGLLRSVLSNSLSEVKLHSAKQDRSDNEYTFYTGLEYKMNSYNVKPAIFDLFLMICIACYLAVFYLISQYFAVFSAAILRTTTKSTKAN